MEFNNIPQQPPSAFAAPPELIKEIALPLFRSKMWLRLLGILSIISGIFTIFTIIGILFCWLPIWLGVLLFQSAGSLENAYLSGQKEELMQAMDKLRLYFIIMGIFSLIGLIFGLLSGLFGVLMTFA